MIKNILFIILILFFFSACKQKALEPSYLSIQNFIVSTNTLTEGTSNQNITEVLVYIDDQNAGVYHLPATVPLGISGRHKITLAPAVVENAMASNKRYAYLFLTAYDTTLNFTSGNLISVTPRIRYRTNDKFVMIEDFENPLSIFGRTTYSDSIELIRDSIPADNLEFGHCALFNVGGYSKVEYSTRTAYNLPTSSTSETFVEINYKTELPLAIGLYIIEPSISTVIKSGVLTLNPKSAWSKAYINLTDIVSVKPVDTKFSLFFYSYNNTGEIKKVFIDNIKIIRFE